MELTDTEKEIILAFRKACALGDAERFIEVVALMGNMSIAIPEELQSRESGAKGTIIQFKK